MKTLTQVKENKTNYIFELNEMEALQLFHLVLPTLVESNPMKLLLLRRMLHTFDKARILEILVFVETNMQMDLTLIKFLAVTLRESPTYQQTCEELGKLAMKKMEGFLNANQNQNQSSRQTRPGTSEEHQD